MQNIVLNREKSRLLDQRAISEYGMSGLVLMENAGRGATDILCRLGIIDSDVFHDPNAGLLAAERFSSNADLNSHEVVICCGKGNNAGDGFVIARHLDLRGFSAQVLLWADPKELTGDAAANFEILTKSDVPIETGLDEDDLARVAPLFDRAAWLVDALLGTGTRGEPRSPFAAVIEQMNASSAPIFAVDLPSGLDCETGEPARVTIQAAHTCTFATMKSGFLQPSAKPYLGELHVADIGVPRRLLEEMGG